MANKNLYNGPEATLYLEKAPYIQYLTALGQSQASALKKDLVDAAKRIKQEISVTSRRSPYSNVIAQVLDIEAGRDGKSDVLRRHVGDTLDDGGLVIPKPRKVGAFLDQLGECKSSVHTRIIVFNPGRRFSLGNSADSLLFCHILGVKLDLPVSVVQCLADLVRSDDAQSQERHRLPMMSGFVSLGESTYTNTKSRGLAAYLGRRQVNGVYPHIVVVHLHSGYDHDCSLPCTQLSGLWEPSPYSQWDPQTPMSIPSLSTVKLFDHALKSGLQSSPALQDGEMTGFWLSALIYLDADIQAYRLDHIKSLWFEESSSSGTARLHSIFLDAKQRYCEVKSSVNQVTAFVKSCPSVRKSDYQETFGLLERLLEEAKDVVEEIKDALDDQHRIKTLEVSSLAMQESRSAIAVTVLAFIFIPINLASSVYGMNVQEINETGHSIWGFLVTALVLLTCSGLAWFTWRASVVLRETKWQLPKAALDSLADLMKLPRRGKFGTGPGVPY